MNPLTRTTPAIINLEIIDHRTGDREVRVESVANVVGIKLLQPDGEIVELDEFTVPEAGKLRIEHDLTLAGMHEIVARLEYDGQSLPTSVFRFRVDKDRYGEDLLPGTGT